MRTLIAVSLFILAACTQDAPAPSQYAPPRFLQEAPFSLDAAQIEYEMTNTQFEPMNLETITPVTFNEALRQWGDDRLSADGHEGRMVIRLDEAKIVRVDLPRTKGIKGAFTTDQAERYDARLRVTIALYQGTGLATAEANVNVTKSISLSEKASIRDREAAMYGLVQNMMNAYNAEATRQIHRYFGPYINRF